MAYLDDNTSQQFHNIDYDLKREQRAVKHRKLGDRNNVTTCRSPTRDLDTRRIKGELHRKRQEEFSKRRPAGCDTTALLSARTRRQYTREEARVTQRATSFSWPLMDDPMISSVKKVVTSSSLNNGKGSDLKHEGVPDALGSLQQRANAKNKRALLRDITQLKTNQRPQHAASVQTELGVTTVKDVDVVQLANYLEEALYREEALKKKLATLQNSASTLLRSTELLWKTRCDEDLLKSKIKALEAQLQIYTKRVPQDGMKRVILNMEKQKEEYEHKALEAIQKATEKNTEAQSKMEHLQEALQAAQAESVRWRTLCGELRESSSQLRKSHDQNTDQLLQLQCQLERSREQEESLRILCESLQLEGAELRSNISLLEQDNQTLTEELEQLAVQSRVSWNNNTEAHQQRDVGEHLTKTDNHIAEQLRLAERRLSLKENECVELKAELETLEQECYSFRSRLAQCREELNTLSARKNSGRSKRRSCGPCVCLSLFLMLLLIVLMAAIWICYPPIREQLWDFYSVVEERVEDYLVLWASAQNAISFRPI
ncbi:TRAF3-interacting JNK-activating modulator [Brachyhypopomus gauderio]|uniref:TRAF3-interacting JNK-activating modulator n=1 Tax=Brachyhypopomus gauderio TaxID=698409 RepID=UPI0040410EBD